MKKRLISLVILLVVAGSAVAGAPLHSNEQSCSMGGAMGEMDCCKAALSHNNTPQVAGARLCCVKLLAERYDPIQRGPRPTKVAASVIGAFDGRSGPSASGVAPAA